jgi:hypothetical protein
VLLRSQNLRLSLRFLSTCGAMSVKAVIFLSLVLDLFGKEYNVHWTPHIGSLVIDNSVHHPPAALSKDCGMVYEGSAS